MKPNFILPRIAALIVLAVAITACGQRGPLYMPGSAPQKKPSKAAAQFKSPTTAKPDASTPPAAREAVAVDKNKPE